MQPHAPYLPRQGPEAQTDPEGDPETGRSREGNRRRWRDSLLARRYDPPEGGETLEGSELAQKAGLWLELDPADLVKNGTREAAMELYEENLRIALESVADVASELDGTVVVTADHGEAFGEEGVWEHHIETHIPALMEVPWIEVE